jgi:hypothetical protein
MILMQSHINLKIQGAIYTTYCLNCSEDLLEWELGSMKKLMRKLGILDIEDGCLMPLQQAFGASKKISCC